MNFILELVNFNVDSFLVFQIKLSDNFTDSEFLEKENDNCSLTYCMTRI